MRYHVNNLNMRLSFILFLFSFFSACTPRGIDDMSLGGTFQIKAKILNPQDTLNLGDSLKVVFEIPDTIFLQGGIPYNVGDSSKSIILTDKISCTPQEKVEIADSTTSGGITLASINNSCVTYADPGYFINDGLNLVKSNNRLYAKYFLIPKKKGVFILSNWTATGGYFSGVSSLGKISCRIVFDFDVANKHHYLLQSAIGANNDISSMINDRASHGQGVYVFAVK